LLSERGFSDADERAKALKQLQGRRSAREDIQLLLLGYDVALKQEDCMEKRLVREARKVKMIRRFADLPGIKWIRASTFYAYVDTPWRFKKKSGLWKYLGIGLDRRTSGGGPVCLHVARNANRRLKDMILGAAESAARSKDGNPFALQYRRYLDGGLSPKNARRSVARSQAAVLWGMWKSGDVYRPELVGVAVASKETVCMS
jgi:transposase